jgi:pullulanase
MRNSPTNLMRWVCSMLALCALTLLAACGGGGISNSASSATSVGDATDLKTVLAAVPAAGGGGGGGANVVRLYYNRPDAAYGGWTLYTYGGADLGGWPGKVPDGDDASAGKYWDITVTGPSFNFIIVKDGGGTREPSGWSGANNDQQQFWALADGKSIYKVAGDKTNYTSNPAGAATPDIETVRVHYKRFDGQYSNWGVHIWDGSGLDVSRLKAGVTINEWTNAVPFTDFNNYATGSGEIVFDIPVLNPVADPTRTNLQFIIHGKPPGGDANDKDGRNDNISVSYAALKIAGKVGEVWMIQGDATVYTAFPDTRLASTTDARAFWLNKSLIQFPKIGNGGVFKLYHSARGQIKAARDEAVTGADGSITLDIFGGIVPPDVSTRFKYVAAGVVLQVKNSDAAQLPTLLKSQLVLVQEDAAGLVQNASTAQLPGVLDDLYAAAGAVPDLGVSIAGGQTRFKLWAPTAQKVSVALYSNGQAQTSTLLPATFDAATGVWTASRDSDLSGQYYRYVVEVFVRGVGLVRQLVTDPYSISLAADSKRSYIADLGGSAQARRAGTPRHSHQGGGTDRHDDLRAARA